MDYKRDMRRLKTVGEIIDAIGSAQLRKLSGQRSKSAVSNWRRAGRFPAKTFYLFTSELARRGLSADPALWGMKESERA